MGPALPSLPWHKAGEASVLQSQNSSVRKVPFHCLGIGLECLRREQGAESTTLTQLLQPQLPWALGPPPQRQLCPQIQLRGHREQAGMTDYSDAQGELQAEWNESFVQGRDKEEGTKFVSLKGK